MCRLYRKGVLISGFLLTRFGMIAHEDLLQAKNDKKAQLDQFSYKQDEREMYLKIEICKT